MYQDLIVFVIIGLTLSLTIYSSIKNLRTKTIDNGCGGCTACNIKNIKANEVKRIRCR